MALFGAEFIAVPDGAKGQIVFKWPDVTIRRFTRAIVNADRSSSRREMSSRPSWLAT